MPRTKLWRVLIVDDDVDIAQSYAMIMRHLGHIAHYVLDPRVAVRHAVDFQPEVILLDIGMPHINGYDLAPQLRAALPQRVPIVAVTAWGSEQDRLHSAALGFFEHLVKPVRMDQFEALLKRLSKQA